MSAPRRRRVRSTLTIDRLPRRVAQAGDAITLPGGFRPTTGAGGATVTQPASQEAQAHANARSVTLTVCLDGWCGWLGGDLTGGGLNTPDVERLVSRELGAMAFVKVPHFMAHARPRALDWSRPSARALR